MQTLKGNKKTLLFLNLLFERKQRPKNKPRNALTFINTIIFFFEHKRDKKKKRAVALTFINTVIFFFGHRPLRFTAREGFWFLKKMRTLDLNGRINRRLLRNEGFVVSYCIYVEGREKNVWMDVENRQKDDWIYRKADTGKKAKKTQRDTGGKKEKPRDKKGSALYFLH